MNRDFLTEPAWSAEELGTPLPDSDHAVSVCLPRWHDVLDYENGVPEVVGKLKAGYPRFRRPTAVQSLEREIISSPLEECLIFSSFPAAQRCRHFIMDRHDGWRARIEEGEKKNHRWYAVIFPLEIGDTARKFWRFCGEGISSRQAESILNNNNSPAAEGENARKIICQRISDEPENVRLFPSGMAAIAAVHRALIRLRPGFPTIQINFPYVDALKVQREFGAGARYLSSADEDWLGVLEQSARDGLAGVFGEAPANPLLDTPDFLAIREICSKYNVPLIIDDTVATHHNIDAGRFADLVTTSLTKSFSGVGDVMAGCARLGQGSSLLWQTLLAEADTPLGDADAIALEKNSRGFANRVERSNATAAELVDWVRAQDEVDHVFFPKKDSGLNALLRPDAVGVGSLFSVLLRKPEMMAPIFYDHLRISKGPSLGNSFSLVCPYTLLAHFHELPWAESCGVSRWLIRFSIGLEPVGDLKSRIRHALDQLPK